jgi:hypothetical protein
MIETSEPLHDGIHASGAGCSTEGSALDTLPAAKAREGAPPLPEPRAGLERSELFQRNGRFAFHRTGAGGRIVAAFGGPDACSEDTFVVLLDEAGLTARWRETSQDRRFLMALGSPV